MTFGITYLIGLAIAGLLTGIVIGIIELYEIEIGIKELTYFLLCLGILGSFITVTVYVGIFIIYIVKNLWDLDQSAAD